VLGKLPEIAESYRGGYSARKNKGAISNKNSDDSTACNTELSVATKPLVEEVDGQQ